MHANRPSALLDDPATDPLVLGVRTVRTVIVVRAVLALAFGLVALFWPDLTVLALAIAFGIYAILEGVASVIDAVRHRDRSRWWLGLLGGLASVAAGVLALIWPGITALVLAVVVGIWAVVAGAAQIATAFRLRMVGGRIWLLALAGVLSVMAGIVILVWPSAGVIGLAVLLGVFAVVYGAALGALAVALRSPVP
ncbi:HdeD family acid-resistance protein [Pseudonocardia sp. CA-142604]|uniref:HdeD family acid-resistance protein n=1 Tax=Pseudonocardia sp. CA-142604 TaxID=3240024 RepID=UPI003D8E1D69